MLELRRAPAQALRDRRVRREPSVVAGDLHAQTRALGVEHRFGVHRLKLSDGIPRNRADQPAHPLEEHQAPSPYSRSIRSALASPILLKIFWLSCSSRIVFASVKHDETVK